MLGTIRKVQKGYVVDVSLNGARKTKQCRLKSEAIQIRKEINEELAELFKQEAMPSVPIKNRLGITLKELKRLGYERHYKKLASGREAMLGMDSLINYFGEDFEIQDLTAIEFDNFREDELSKDNQPSTVNKKHSYLNVCMDVAVRYGFLTQENYPLLPKRLKEVPLKRRCFTNEEQDFFIHFFTRSTYPQLADLFVFSLETCVRWGEGAKMKRDHFSVKCNPKTVYIPETKNGASRTVHLSDKAWKVVEPWLKGKKMKEKVWLSDGLTYDRVRRLVDKAKHAMGVKDFAKLTWHCTRHTCATRLIADPNVKQFDLMAFGGWKTLKAVQVYLHTNTHPLNRCVEALNK